MAKTKYGNRHLLYPQPAVLAGAMVNGKPNYLTIAWCGIMQATPPLIYISVRKERYSLPGIVENGTFSVNVPSANQAAVTDFCGLHSGRNTDKSKLFTNFFGELKTAPMIEEFPINMECSLVHTIDLESTHVVFIGQIVQTYVNEDCIVDGVPDVPAINPLIFTTEGFYWKFGDKVASAHSVGRTYKPD